MTQGTDIENKWIRVQASLDELGDSLAIRLRTVVLKIGEGDTLEAVRLLEEVIEAVEVFSGPSEEQDD